MNLLSIFAHSTFYPIKHHMDIIYQIMHIFPSFLDEVLENNWTEACRIQQKMHQLQQQASELKHHILLQITKHSFKPAASGDIFELIAEQNRIAKSVQSIADIMIERKINLPSKVAHNYLGFSHACLAATLKAKNAVDALESFLKESENQSIRLPFYRILVELEELVFEAYKIHQELKNEVMRLEKKIQPSEVNFLYKIFESTEGIVIKAQQIGCRLQLLLSTS